MRLWLSYNDYEEYDVKFGSWQIYSHIYKDNFHDDKIIYDEDVLLKENVLILLENLNIIEK